MRVHAILLGHDDQIVRELEIEYRSILFVPRPPTPSVEITEGRIDLLGLDIEVERWEHNQGESDLYATAFDRRRGSIAVYRKMST